MCRLPADQLREQTVLVVDEGQRALLEFLEELIPRDLGEIVVFRLLRAREHDAHDAYVALIVRTGNGGGLAAMALRPLPYFFMVGCRFTHGCTSRVDRSTGKSVARRRGVDLDRITGGDTAASDS